jgi:hypothetical protein
MKLSKAIIKKYGITKKAWQIARSKRGGNSPKRAISSTSKSRSRRSYTMAKRKKNYSRKSAGMPSWAKLLISSGISLGYGAFRNDIAAKLPKIPKAENYSTELELGGAAIGLSMLTGNKWVNMVTKPIANIEMANIGEKIRLKVPLSNNANGSTTSTSGEIAY